MDKKLISRRFSKAVQTYTREANAQQRIASHMTGLLRSHMPSRPPIRHIVEFGCGTGIYSQMLLRQYRPETITLNDLCPDMLEYCRQNIRYQVGLLPGDAENIEFPHHTDLITSCSALQWFEHPARFFRRCLPFLRPDGILAFSTFGPDNLQEVRHITGQGLAYPTLNYLTRELSSDYDICHAEEEHFSYSFDHPMQVLEHLKKTGVTGISSQPWTRQDLRYFCDAYQQSFSRPDHTVTLTYHPIYIIAKKRNL